MSQAYIKLGVVGLGRGFYVAKRVLGDPRIRVTALCDRNEEKLGQAIETMRENGLTDFQTFASFDEMMAQGDFDAIFIATDAIFHVPYVIRALDAGKHVLSEIPAVNSLEEARQLKAAVKRHPELKYMAGENCCYWAFIQAWKGYFDEGKFGEPVYAEAEYIHSQDWRERKAEDYPPDHWRTFNPAIKYLTHSLGPLLYIMNDRCVSVSCMTPDVVYNPYRPQKNAVAIFKTEKGAVIRILITFDLYADFDHNYRLMGTRGSIETDQIKPVSDEACFSYARFSDVPGSIKDKIQIPVCTHFPGESKEGHGGADAKMMGAFADCILNDTPSPIDVDLAIQMTIPGIIAHESSVQGGAVLEIPLID